MKQFHEENPPIEEEFKGKYKWYLTTEKLEDIKD